MLDTSSRRNDSVASLGKVELTRLDGMYGNFAGRDASRGMAKQSFDEGESQALDCSFIIMLILQRCSRRSTRG